MTEESPSVGRVVIVDDDPGQRALVALNLQEEGFAVRAFKSGPECIEHAATFEPEVILLDINMPGMNGIETCRRLKHHPALKHVPVVFVTGMDDHDRTTIEALQAGGSDFVSKDASGPILFARIRCQVTICRTTQRLAHSEARMRAELDAAANIQALLFPEQWPADSLDFACSVQRCEETGGDLCGYLEFGAGITALYVADVTGHGAASALGTTVMYCTLRSLEQAARARRAQSPSDVMSPAEIMTALNAALVTITQSSLFASCFVAVFDPATQHVQYASAGHERPFLSRGDSTTSLALAPTPLLGSSRSPDFPVWSAPFLAGDVLFVYTDGLTSVRGPSGRTLERRKLVDTLSKAPRHSATAVKAAIEAAFRSVIPPGVRAEDDVTYVVVRRAK